MLIVRVRGPERLIFFPGRDAWGLDLARKLLLLLLLLLFVLPATRPQPARDPPRSRRRPARDPPTTRPQPTHDPPATRPGESRKIFSRAARLTLQPQPATRLRPAPEESRKICTRFARLAIMPQNPPLAPSLLSASAGHMVLSSGSVQIILFCNSCSPRLQLFNACKQLQLQSMIGAAVGGNGRWKQ